VQLAGNEVRWQLLGLLSRSDRRVRELTRLLGQPQSLVSYHLGKLQTGGLVTKRRSSADRRDAYYSLDLVRCGELLAATGAALHPGLGLPAPTPAEPPAQVTDRTRVLFLCTGNSARSQMAEAFAQNLVGAAIDAHSAGSRPKPIHPNAVAAMREHNINIDGRTSKNLSRYTAQRFHYVITMCDRVREICPEFPGHPEFVHWSMPDPSAEGDTDAQTFPAFQRTAADVRTRVAFLHHIIDHSQPTQKAE
jgi:protein-tyrosine-phosphatase/DNA-binding transcriptional ArsR family regulator